MRRYDGKILLSSGDLVAFLGCHHASALDFRALDEALEEADDDPTLKLVKDKGIAHELAYLERLEAEESHVIRIPDKVSLPDRLRLTVEAMRSGADVVYQAALLGGNWHGFADFLIKTDEPSDIGNWSYEVADTKLSGSVKARYAVQLSIYTDLLAQAQGVRPRRMSLVLGDGHTEFLRPDDFVHYVRLAAGRLEAFLCDDTARTATVPEPCAHCEMCRWRDRCAEEWETTDHLSLVANIRRSQRDKLVAAGISTVTALAQMPENKKVPDLAQVTLTKLRAQARLQHSVRGTDQHRHEILTALPGHGFDRLPPDIAGDLFFDMEGDPLFRDPGRGDSGLEYLFGVFWGDPAAGTFLAFWGHDRDQEKRALEEFLDFVAAHLANHPDAHIYHYNHYEVSAVRRLAMRHATREAVVDDLLRRQKFVDLFKVVREALLISEPAYSLKNVEHFYMPKREGNVATAGDSIVAYETWRVTGEQRLLDEIVSYNAIDCRSTAMLRNWLISVRPKNASCLHSEAKTPDAAALERQHEAEQERMAIEAALTKNVTADELPFRHLLVDLVEFHRREKKPEWWGLFDRQGRDNDDLIDDAECLGGLKIAGPPVSEKRSFLHTYHFPPQDTKLARGDRPLEVHGMEAAGSIESLDIRKGKIVLKRAASEGLLPAELALGPGKPIEDKVLRSAVKRFVLSIAEGRNQFPALESLLRRRPPRLHGRKPGAPILSTQNDLINGVIEAVSALDESWLFVQGPPGSGKTWTSSRVIVELMRRGKTVGVSSNSHKAINNLLAGVEEAAREIGWVVNGCKKSTADNPETAFAGKMIGNCTDAREIRPGVPLMAGTAWLFAREELEGAVDYLFVDEAGQISLANLVAMGTAARNIILVGDQMQLGQPIQGTHPGESGAGVLDYLLQGAATVASDRGIFLNHSWRMHPVLCDWVSGAIYEGRLQAAPSMKKQALLLGADAHPALAAHGLKFVTVDHSGRAQGCPEEAEMIRAIWSCLMKQKWRDRDGIEHPIRPADVLVVAPYNVQCNTIRELLPEDARVGTVDKFQGQEAPVTLISMTSSSGEDMPRGIDFLFSRNRLNVAVSRARCLSVILASPRLLEVACNRIEDMRLVDALCHAYEYGRVAH